MNLKMKLSIYKDEWWPVYMVEPCEHGSPFEEGQIDAPDELYERYEKLMSQFQDMQDELRKLKSSSSF